METRFTRLFEVFENSDDDADCPDDNRMNIPMTTQILEDIRTDCPGGKKSRYNRSE